MLHFQDCGKLAHVLPLFKKGDLQITLKSQNNLSLVV